MDRDAKGPEIVSCPSCSRDVTFAELNEHLDKCLAGQQGASAASALPASSSSDGGGSHPASVLFASSGPAQKRKELEGSKHGTKIDDGLNKESSPRQDANRAKGAIKRLRVEPHASLPSAPRDRMASVAPLAERLRPKTLEDFVGQTDVVKGPLRSMLRQARIPSMILWGPPGSGKTTLARIVTRSANEAAAAAQHESGSSGGTSASHGPFRFVEISATTASTSDCKKIFDESINRLQLTGQQTVIFIDEVQRFSRAQQDIFLPVVEKGHCILIAATTENPSFRLQSALLSRMRVFVLSKLSQEECYEVLHRARGRVEETGHGIDDLKQRVDDDLLRWMANVADGDARTSISVLELAIDYLEAGSSTEENIAKLKKALQRNILYDRTGDGHYDTISALHKSIRGSNADAALYWLARMVEAGDDPLFVARRLIVAASEDCNTLEALQMATATYQACQVVGLPECGETLAQCVVFLAESPKSTRAYRGWKKAQALVHESYNYPVPIHIRNAPTRLMKDLGYAKEYRYEPSWVHPVHQEYFPPELKQSRLLSPPLEAEEFHAPKNNGLSSSESDVTLEGEKEGETQEKDEALRRQEEPQEPRLMSGQAGIGPGSCQRIFRVGARAADLDLLDEWEQEQNGGQRWKGRKALIHRIRREGKPVDDQS